MTNILWVTIRVEDSERMAAFYQEYFHITDLQWVTPSPSAKVCFLTADNGMKLELAWHDGEPATGTGRISVGYATTEYDRLLALAREQGILDSEPVTIPVDGTQFFFVHDPEGNPVQIIRG